ncbi:MAG: DUF4249 domain-containing protein [Bacteroidota bacterium]
MNSFKYYFYYSFTILGIIALAFILHSCNFDKEINVDLPDYNKQLAVECYLDPGKPLAAYISHTSGYFDDLSNPLVSNALVLLHGPDGTDTLYYKPIFDTSGTKLYNFTNSKLFNPTPGGHYTLEAVDSEKNKLFGEANYLPLPVVDTLYYTYRKIDSSASITVMIKDDSNANNYYRILMNVDTLENKAKHDALMFDALFNGQTFPVATSNKFKLNDTVFVRVYNIDKGWFDFITSVRAAERANGNPFSQPAVIKSSVREGFGIFTCQSYTLNMLIIKDE